MGIVEKSDSIWLGQKGQNIVRKIMWYSLYITLALVLWVTVGDMLFDLGVELRSLLSPTQNIHILLTFIFGIVALFSAGIYFSDYQGNIEVKPASGFDIFSLIWTRITMIGIVAIVLIMFFEVISRYLFDAPTLWANEASLWIAGFVFLLSGLYAMQQRSHIRIYIIYDMFPRWMQKMADSFTVFLLWIFTISLIWGSYGEAIDKFERMETFGTAWDPPIPGTLKIGILIIIIMVTIQATINLIKDWHNAPESHSPMDDIDEDEINHIRKSIED